MYILSLTFIKCAKLQGLCATLRGKCAKLQGLCAALRRKCAKLQGICATRVGYVPLYKDYVPPALDMCHSTRIMCRSRWICAKLQDYVSLYAEYVHYTRNMCRSTLDMCQTARIMCRSTLDMCQTARIMYRSRWICAKLQGICAVPLRKCAIRTCLYEAQSKIQPSMNKSP